MARAQGVMSGSECSFIRTVFGKCGANLEGLVVLVCKSADLVAATRAQHNI